MEFDFAEVVENGEAIPEQFRPLYAQNQEGKYELVKDEKVMGARQALLGLNTALKAAREENKGLKKSKIDLSGLAEYGEKPEEIITNVQAKIKELADQIASGAKVNPDKIKADLQAGWTQEREKLTKRAEALEKQLHTMMVDNAITSASAELKGVPDLLLPFVRNQVKVVEEDGQLAVKVVDDAGDVRYSSVTGKPMSIKELVASMKSDQKYGRLFDSEAPQGGGQQPGSGQRRTNAHQGEKSANQKIASGLQRLRQQRGF